MAALFPWRVNWLAAVATVLFMHTTVGQGQQTQPSTTQPASGQREFVEIRLRMLPSFGLPLRGPSPELLAKYNIAPPRKGPRPPFMAPRGTTNVALHCRVTSSNKVVRGSLQCVTDGNVNAYQEDNVVELQPGLQWIQIDLEQPCEIWGILVRHQINRARAYKDVVIQVADDSDFTANVRTLFNNDDDNSSGLGKGTDQMYFDNHVGNLIEAKGIRGQYIRLYSNGNTEDDKNHYTEVEVYGLPSAPELVEIKLPGEKLPWGPPRHPPADVLPHIEPVTKNSRQSLKAPRGTTNLSLHCPVTSSTAPVQGELKQITDGIYYGLDEAWVELEPGVQWIQVDLGKPHPIWGILAWHSIESMQWYKSVVVQISDDEYFRVGVTTVFNNDYENRVGQGKGRDLLYFESTRGRLFLTQGTPGRFVRLYSTGSVFGDASRYIEVHVYGLPTE